ncbi:MAG: hypothetical protein ACI9KE_000254 [Polyangiales bacterium]|jgi:hypothetical protein
MAFVQKRDSEASENAAQIDSPIPAFSAKSDGTCFALYTMMKRTGLTLIVALIPALLLSLACNYGPTPVDPMAG